MDLRYNIVFLSSDSNPEFIGGIKRVTSILAKEWLKQGHNTFFLTFCNNEKRLDPKYSSFEGVPQFFLQNYGNLNSENNLIEIKEFLKISNQNPLIILNPHVEDIKLTEFSFYVAKELNGKLFQALHFHPNFEDDLILNSFFSNYRYKGLNPLKQFPLDVALYFRYYLFRRKQDIKSQSLYLSDVYAKSDMFIALSRSFLPMLRKKIKADDYSHLNFINNPTLATSDNQFDYQNKNKVVIWAGRMDNYYKRIDRMLKIWKQVAELNPDWTLKVIGSGNIEAVKKIVQKEGIKNIEILGFQNPEPFYKEASVVCSTSVSEGWGMTLVEGMEYGCVPIAYDNGGSVTDIIENNKSGYIIPQGNIKKYVTKLDYLIKNKDKRIEMAQKAIISVTKFNPSPIATQWIKLFNE